MKNKHSFAILSVLLTACGSSVSNSETSIEESDSSSGGENVVDNMFNLPDSEIGAPNELEVASSECHDEWGSYFSSNMNEIQNADMLHKTFRTPADVASESYGESHLANCVLAATEEMYSSFGGCKNILIDEDPSTVCQLTLVLDDGQEYPVSLVVTTRQNAGFCKSIFDVYMQSGEDVAELGSAYKTSNDESGEPVIVFQHSDSDAKIFCSWDDEKTTVYRPNVDGARANGFHSFEDHKNSGGHE